MQKLNLFYEEPDPDRWFKYDRYLRKVIRQMVRKKPQPGGVMMVALELMKGLDKLKIPYRYNDYQYAKTHPYELIGVIGKYHLLKEKQFKNPIFFGAGIFSHPFEAPHFLDNNPNIKQILVPGDWMLKLFKSFYGDIVTAWPVGIDTEKWNPNIKKKIEYDFLIYDKIRWNHDEFERSLIEPIKAILEKNGLSYSIITYGKYTHQQLLIKLAVSKAAIFLCEHETQGQAYQQILASNTPILAYDQQDVWLDPAFYPDRVKYGPVSAVPYWDDKCGIKFKSIDKFSAALKIFQGKLIKNEFNPRDYIMLNLTLEKCALEYYDIYTTLAKNFGKT